MVRGVNWWARFTRQQTFGYNNVSGIFFMESLLTSVQHWILYSVIHAKVKNQWSHTSVFPPYNFVVWTRTNSTPLYLSHLNPLCLFKNLLTLLFSHLCQDLVSDLFSSRFPIKMSALLISHGHIARETLVLGFLTVKQKVWQYKDIAPGNLQFLCMVKLLKDSNLDTLNTKRVKEFLNK